MNKSSTIPTNKALWNSICGELSLLMSSETIQRWFKPLRLIEVNDERILLESDNSIYQFWIEENYSSQLSSVLLKTLGRKVSVTFFVSGEGNQKTSAQEIVSSKKETQKAKSANTRNGLNSRFTFENFVVGTNTELANAAAIAVSKSPGRTYNPLFLHGSVGLGKTHLMHAIGNLILQKKRSNNVQYITSEQFTNEFIDAVQNNALVKFRKRYRQVDVLLIDDVQFFSKTDKCQEEFFHTFNSLFDGHKQIVLTCDSPPSEISNIEKRLVSRFEWGLTAELQLPDMETRHAILRQKLKVMNVDIPDEILRFIAEKVKKNVRRLEGALTRVAAYAALQSSELTVSQVESLLKDLLQNEAPALISIDTIQRKVAETYDLRFSDLLSKQRPVRIALPRMIGMYLSRKMTTQSLNEIGKAFGGRDHGTVLHAAKVIRNRMQVDSKFAQTVNFLEEKIANL